MKYLTYILVNSLFLILTANLSCHKQAILPPPNIVWITSEDNSKHYLKLFDEDGIETPNIEWLAERGITFTRAFSNAPVCSVARSTLISGCYGPRIGTQFHRKLKIVPMPENLEMFPAYLRKAGYYTSNNSKEDYNVTKKDDVWDESSREASWKNRQAGQPFFHVSNIVTTHESRLHFNEALMDTVATTLDPKTVKIFPNHPSTALFRFTNAYYRDKIQAMDRQVGEVVEELKKDGLLDNTIIFYFADHGGVLPGSKGYLYETGLHIPLVVYVPRAYKRACKTYPGSTIHGFVSFIDFAPTVLNLAGIDIPKAIDGQAFLGKNITKQELNERDETFSYADRFDEKYDMVRSLRKGKYKYIRSYQPFNYDGLMNNYRYLQMAYREWKDLHEKNELNHAQSRFFEPRAPELLFDLEADPFETNNLADDVGHVDVLSDMRARLTRQVKEMPDLSFYPEPYLIDNAFDDPVKFGQKHKGDIENYVDIANLSLSDFEEIKMEIETHLQSSDPWERYWALVVCSSLGKEAMDLIPHINQIKNTDAELINRVRAAEFLGVIKAENPSKVMISALYKSRDGAEALLILNSIVLMKDGAHQYPFDIQWDKIAAIVKENSEVKRRLRYLKVIS